MSGLPIVSPSQQGRVKDQGRRTYDWLISPVHVLFSSTLEVMFKFLDRLLQRRVIVESFRLEGVLRHTINPRRHTRTSDSDRPLALVLTAPFLQVEEILQIGFLLQELYRVSATQQNTQDHADLFHSIFSRYFLQLFPLLLPPFGDPGNFFLRLLLHDRDCKRKLNYAVGSAHVGRGFQITKHGGVVGVEFAKVVQHPLVRAARSRV